jgi:hypothetical protein
MSEAAATGKWTAQYAERCGISVENILCDEGFICLKGSI